MNKEHCALKLVDEIILRTDMFLEPVISYRLTRLPPSMVSQLYAVILNNEFKELSEEPYDKKNSNFSLTEYRIFESTPRIHSFLHMFDIQRTVHGDVFL